MSSRASWWLVGLVLFGACDCEDQLRRAVSNSGDRKMPSASHPGGSGPAESEPNDKPESASPVRLGKELRDVTGAISRPDDVDWFSLSADAEESFELVVTPDPSLDLSLHVDVEGGAALTYNDGLAGSAERVGVLKIGPAAQHIALRSKGNSRGGYKLSFKRHLSAEGLEAEPNDDAKVATLLSMPGEIQGFFDRPDDRDVYRLTGDADKAFILELGPVAGGREIARIFDDATLNKPALTVQVTDTPVVLPNVAIGPTAPRWLVLTPIGSPRADQPYRLRLTPHPPTDGPLELEPNDELASPLPFGEPGEAGARTAVVSGYIHAADDRDRFELTPPKMVETTTPIPPEREQPDFLAPFRTKVRPQVPVLATLTWSDETSSFGMRWQGGDGTEVEFRQNTPVPKVEACGLNLDAGPAVVEVRAARLGASPTIGSPQYTLTVVESSAAEGFEGEPNNTREHADTLETARRGTFALPNDVDLFAFGVNAEPGGVRKVKLEAAARGVDLVMRILDDSGGVVANVDNVPIGSAERVELDLPAGLYFAEMQWKAGDLCAPYTLDLELP